MEQEQLGPTNSVPELKLTFHGKPIAQLSEDELRQACVWLAARFRESELMREKLFRQISDIYATLRSI